MLEDKLEQLQSDSRNIGLEKNRPTTKLMRNQIFPPLAIHLADKGIEEARDRKTDGCGTFESRMYGQKCIYRTGEQDERRVVEAVALTFQFRISLLFR